MRHPKCPKRRSTPSAPGKFCSGGLFDEITDALLIIESDGGRILCSNREAQRLFDKGADDLAGRPFELLIAPSARTRVHAALDTVSQEATGSRSAARPLARVEVVSSAAQPVEVEMWLAQGGPAISPVTHILALFRALDRDRMRNGHEKVERDEHFDLLDLAQDAIFVRDFSTRTIRYWNRGAETLYGWSAAEAIGQVSDSLLATRFPEPLEVIESSLASDGQWHGELVHTAHDGRRIVVNSRWALRRDSNGSPAAILEVNTDVTERRQADELLPRTGGAA